MSVVVPEQMVVFADPAWRADLGLLAESSRIAARGFAADAFLLSDLADRVPEPTGTRDGELAWQAFVREVALARGLQERAAAREIAIARLLARHLPRTVELLACGTLLLPRAVAFVDELVGVDPATVRQVDRMLAERLPSMAPGRIRLEVRRAVDRIDADAAADRAAKAAAGRAVRVRADQDGQASAYLNGPAVPMTRWFQALTETARALQVAGDPRGLDALRFDLVMGGFALDEPPAAPPLPAQAVGVPAEDEEDIPEALRPAPGATPQPLPTGSPQPQPQSPPWPEEQLQLQPEGVAVDDPDAPGTSPWQPVSLEITLAQQRALDEAPAAAVPPDDDPPVVCDALVRASREQAARVLEQARERAERVLEAAHAAEAESLHRLAQIRAEHDRLLALVVRERLCVSSTLPSDRRASRPVQVLVHVPVTTALGLSDEPGWLDGYGWIGAPQTRQLLPAAELRQVCVAASGQVVDLAARAVRPEPTPQGVREALLRMATEAFAITAAAWQEQDQHDPSPALADLVRVRDRFCDGPLGTLVPAGGADLDHDQAYPQGPTAAWNLRARGRRTHRHKHHGCTPIRTGGSTTWITPAGQTAITAAHQHAPDPVPADAVLPAPDAQHRRDAELLTPDDRD